jgi:hypothetical protein
MQRPKVGTVIHAVRRQGVSFAMAGKKGDATTGEIAHHNIAGSWAIGRIDALPAGVFQAREFVEAAAADNGKIDR